MDKALQKALYIILISVGLAVVFNFLFFGKLIGISVGIFVGVLLGTLYVFGTRQQLLIRKTWWLALPIVFFALMPGIRANPLLSFFNICATFGLLMLLAFELTGTPAVFMKLRDYFILAVVVPFRMLGRALSTVSMLAQIHSTVKQHDVWLRVIKGVVMAVPILIIFGVLFAQADLVFSQFIKGFVNITISERTVQHFVLMAFAFVAGLCYLSFIFFPKESKQAEAIKKPDAIVQSGRGLEALVFLGLISALFLVFIAFQVTYLFGGETNIINAGFTYAEYARRGFWELLAVSILSLLVLLASEKYSGNELKRDKRFLAPALLLIVEVVIVIVAAFKRLSLYIDAYGMTILRFYVAAFIMVLLVLFILLAVKFIKSKQEQFFAFGALLSAIAFLAILNIVNPDMLIAKTNIEQSHRSGKLDASYFRELSVDTEREKIELYKNLAGEDKEILRGILRKDKDDLLRSSGDWQSINFSRMRALRLLNEVNL
jgi:hypothetical protein